MMGTNVAVLGLSILGLMVLGTLNGSSGAAQDPPPGVAHQMISVP